MKADCHIHMVLDGADWRGAIGRHRNGPDREWIRGRLREYAAAGFAYLRDGGDKWGVGAAAREMAGEWGITYRTPLAPLVFAGHYGGFNGEKYSDLREYAALVKQRREQGADFIKLMISGIMDFDRFGVLSEPGLPSELIRELIRIAHAEGFAVMCMPTGPGPWKRRPRRGRILWSMGPTWTRTPWRRWGQRALSGVRLSLPSATCGVPGVLTKGLCRKSTKAPRKMSAGLYKSVV